MCPLKVFVYGEPPERFKQELLNTNRFYIMDHERGWKYYRGQQVIVIDNFEEQPYFIMKMVFKWITKKGQYYDPDKNDLMILSKYPPSHFEDVEDVLKRLGFSIKVSVKSATDGQFYSDMKKLLHDIQKTPKKRSDTERETKKDILGETLDMLLEQRGRSGAFIVSKTEKSAQNFIDCIVSKPNTVHILESGTRTAKWRRRYTASPIDCKYHLLVLRKEDITTKELKQEMCKTIDTWTQPFVWEKDSQHKPLLVVVPDEPEKFLKFTPEEKEYFDKKLSIITVERKGKSSN